jgi:predicted phage terminase large subunit-like protein
MPRYFNKPTPEFHYELIKIFFRKGNDYTACPRGFAKTTLIQLCIAYSCAHGLEEFIVLIEKTYTEASEVLEAVREEFKMNDDILRVYGDLTKVNTKGQDQDNIRDSTGDFFVNGVRLRAKGFDSPIRGLKSRHSRPTKVILDDIESDEHIDNVEQRLKYLNNYVKGIIPAVDNDTGKIKMFGTILHDDSLLNTLIKEHNGKIYAAWDTQHVLLWPSNWTVDKLEQKREEMRISEKGDAAFYQEYFNQPLDEENQIFKRTMFQYFRNLDLDTIKKRPHRIYTLVDPAISKKTTADFTVILTALVDEFNRIYVLEITRKRMDPMETIKGIFAHYERWNPIYVGIESVSYQKALKFFVDEEKMKQTSSVRTMNVVEIKPTTDKITKIKKLQPKYAILNVFHNSDDRNTSILEEELLRFPKGVHDDCADCLSFLIEIIIPIQQSVQRKYKAHVGNRKATVMY